MVLCLTLHDFHPLRTLILDNTRSGVPLPIKIALIRPMKRGLFIDVCLRAMGVTPVSAIRSGDQFAGGPWGWGFVVRCGCVAWSELSWRCVTRGVCICGSKRKVDNKNKHLSGQADISTTNQVHQSFSYRIRLSCRLFYKNAERELVEGSLCSVPIARCRICRSLEHNQEMDEKSRWMVWVDTERQKI